MAYEVNLGCESFQFLLFQKFIKTGRKPFEMIFNEQVPLLIDTRDLNDELSHRRRIFNLFKSIFQTDWRNITKLLENDIRTTLKTMNSDNQFQVKQVTFTREIPQEEEK